VTAPVLRLVPPAPPAGPPTEDDLRFAVWLILNGQVRFDGLVRHPSGVLIVATATVDGHVCRFQPDTGWTCPCPDPRVDCPHTLAAGRVAPPR
jgi:hypothetical protein